MSGGWVQCGSLADSCAKVETNLVVLRTVCQFITTSEDVKRIFNEIVSCGNYLNGGDKYLGQAGSMWISC